MLIQLFSQRLLYSFCREHDKDPDTFFDILYTLKDEKCDFEVSVMGQGFTDVPGKIN